MTSSITSLIPTAMAKPFARYSHGVSEAHSGLVLTSGQLGITKAGEIPEDALSQAELIFNNIDLILQDAGTSREGVLRISAFVTDRKYMQSYMSARDAWLEAVEHLPASTLVIVSGFTRPEFLVEVEVTAIMI